MYQHIVQNNESYDMELIKLCNLYRIKTYDIINAKKTLIRKYSQRISAYNEFIKNIYKPFQHNKLFMYENRYFF